MTKKQFGILLVIVLAVLWKKFINEGCVCQSDKSLVGKTVIITGGNAGIGKATAIQCAKLKAHLIIASRNVDKSMKARDEIIKETGHHDIHVMKLDLADLDSVSKFADEILSKEKHIDFLINNAGVIAVPGLTKQGIGSVFAINHIGPFLLTNLLLDRMKSHSTLRPVRIINLSSGSHEYPGVIDWDTLTDEKAVGGFAENFAVYGVTKLANIYFTSGLKKRVEGYKIDTFSVHPGLITSELGRHIQHPNMFQEYLYKLFTLLFTRSPYYGCQTIMTCMLKDDILDYNGGYFSDCKPKMLKDFATHPDVEEKLWQVSEKLVKPWLQRN